MGGGSTRHGGALNHSYRNLEFCASRSYLIYLRLTAPDCRSYCMQFPEISPPYTLYRLQPCFILPPFPNFSHHFRTLQALVV